jgi:hypothetical protein
LKIINYINTGKSPFWIAIPNNWINLFYKYFNNW